jgi:hypothetical protein
MRVMGMYITGRVCFGESKLCNCGARSLYLNMFERFGLSQGERETVTSQATPRVVDIDQSRITLGARFPRDEEINGLGESS